MVRTTFQTIAATVVLATLAAGPVAALPSRGGASVPSFQHRERLDVARQGPVQGFRLPTEPTPIGRSDAGNHQRDVSLATQDLTARKALGIVKGVVHPKRDLNTVQALDTRSFITWVGKQAAEEAGKQVLENHINNQRSKRDLGDATGQQLNARNWMTFLGEHAIEHVLDHNNNHKRDLSDATGQQLDARNWMTFLGEHAIEHVLDHNNHKRDLNDATGQGLDTRRFAGAGKEVHDYIRESTKKNKRDLDGIYNLLAARELLLQDLLEERDLSETSGFDALD